MKQADIWRALKPLTYMALALKPSTSIKGVETEKTADGRETEEVGGEEWQIKNMERKEE